MANNRIIVRHGLSAKTRNTLSFFAYISPWLIGFALFTVVPLFMSLIYSFSSVTMVDASYEINFIGLKNYYRIFTEDATFQQAILNTFIYTGIKVAVLVFISLLVALLLNSKIPLKKVFRILIYLPALIPVVSSSLMWKLFFGGPVTAGGGVKNIANFFLSYLGIAPVNFLGNTFSSLGTLIFIGVWSGLGPTMIIFLAAIQGVNQDVMEACDLDGAGPVRKFMHVIIPTIMPVMFFVILTNVISSLQMYTEAKLLTSNSVSTISSVIVGNAFDAGGGENPKALGYACAQGWIIFALTFVLTLIYVKTMNKSEKKG